MSDDATQPVEERRRLRDANGVKIIQSKNLALIREIGSGPEYLFHAGENKGNAVIVKVFNSTGPAVRQQLDAAVALSKGMHPNLLRLLGISSPESCFHFMVYENVHWKNAEGPLSVALKKDLTRSIMLGFKMIAGLSAGINYISLQGVYLGSMKVENFDIFLDVNDRFVMCIHPPSLEDGNTAKHQEPHENAWVLLNGLCEKILVSANHLTHQDQINREPAIVDVVRPGSRPSLLSFGPTSQTIREEEPGVHPRREYIWLTLVRGEQSLATVAHRITLALDTEISSLHRLSQSDGQSAHRCTGYKREEITLATTMLHSAVVAYDAPSPSEICSVCHEVVGHHETFRCVCGASVPGTQHTIKCRACKFWSHSNCVGNSTEFICLLCLRGMGSKLPSTEPPSQSVTLPPPPGLMPKASTKAKRRRRDLDGSFAHHLHPEPATSKSRTSTTSYRVALVDKEAQAVRKAESVFGPTVMCGDSAFLQVQRREGDIEILEAWRMLTSDPNFSDSDLADLCSELSSKARCDGTKVVIEPQGLNNIIGSMNQIRNPR